MQFLCEDPYGTPSRVIDIARRLDVRLEHFHLDQREQGDFVLSFEPADTACHAAQVFRARVALLLDLIPETENA